MNRTWKLLLFTFAGVLLLAACTVQAEVAETTPELAAVVAVDPVTAVPDTPVPTEETIIAAAETQVVAVAPTTEQEESVESIEPPSGQTVNEYVNVSYTQADADLIGKTNRAQFVLTYATWWSSWRANLPVVNRLNEQFSDRVDFFYLDVDDVTTRDVMSALSIRDRTTYVIYDAEGNEVHRWFGPLPFGGAAHDIEVALGES